MATRFSCVVPEHAGSYMHDITHHALLLMTINIKTLLNVILSTHDSWLVNTQMSL